VVSLVDPVEPSLVGGGSACLRVSGQRLAITDDLRQAGMSDKIIRIIHIATHR
jgi:hypothetical protein